MLLVIMLTFVYAECGVFYIVIPSVFYIVIPSVFYIVMLSVVVLYCYAECHYAECHGTVEICRPKKGCWDRCSGANLAD
jgi:hypothetical protein